MPARVQATSVRPVLLSLVRHLGARPLARASSVKIRNSWLNSFEDDIGKRMTIIDAISLPTTLIQVCQELRRYGYQAWLVGGAVRDLLMGRTPHDFDIATDAHPGQVVDVFNKYGHALSFTVPTGEKHGTVTVFWKNFLTGQNDSYEVTTFRTDGNYSDGRRPDEVKFVTTIDDDLARRDFTINAIAYDPLDQVLRDPFSGYASISRKEISCVGLPDERFAEDGLRCLRAIRFAAQLGFVIHESTYSAILPNMESFKKVANERVISELVKIFECDSDRVAIAFTRLMISGIMDAILPEMQPMMGCEQNCYHEFDVMNHTICVLSHVKNDAPVHVKLAALFHDIGKPATQQKHEKRGDFMFLNHEEVSAQMTHEIMTRLKFSNDLRDKVCHLIRHHLVMYTKDWSNATIRRWVRRVGVDNVDDLLDLYRADILGKGEAQIRQSVEPCEELRARVKALGSVQPIVTSTNSLAISGNDVMDRLGIKPGKMVGDVLKQCLEWVTENPECNNQTDLFGYVDAMKNDLTCS